MKIITIIFFILSSWHLLNFLFSRSLKSENKKYIYFFCLGWARDNPGPTFSSAGPGPAWRSMGCQARQALLPLLGPRPLPGQGQWPGLWPLPGQGLWPVPGQGLWPLPGQGLWPVPFGRACGRPFGPCLGAVALAWVRPSAGPAAPAWAGPAGPLGFQETLAHTRVSETLVCRTAKTQGRVWRLGLWRRLGVCGGMRRRRRQRRRRRRRRHKKKNIFRKFKLQNFLCPLMAYIIF